MRKFLISLGLSSLMAFQVGAASAADFSEGSNAKEFGFIDEAKATFSGKVVDIMCELQGECDQQCGGGERLLGIVRDSDNVLVPVLKNAQLAFNGPMDDLAPYCNKAVDVDGLLLGDAELYGNRFYMVQFIREAGAAEWNKANQWTKAWKARNPEATGKGPWFRRDPRVLKQIEANGYFGLGKEADEAYFAENQ